ncbi:MAG TPA: orotidine-5'-phosphate decarboxylase [Acidimicrobiales bacterium]
MSADPTSATEVGDLSGGAPPEIRARLALALDVDDIVEAQRLASELSPWFGVAKVGLELYSAAGPEAIEVLVGDGFEVFADLKLLDIPTTVAKSARVIGSLGASYLTVHTRAGVDHVRAGVEGLAEGANAAGLALPTCLGITVLTSEPADPVALADRVAIAEAADCGGVVCASSDLAQVGALAPDLLTVVPGIRPGGVAHHDQARPATPTEAIVAGAHVLVIGRAVTEAADPVAAAAAIAAEVAAAL